MLYTRQLHFRDVILVHVHKNVLNHDDAEFLLLPDLIYSSQQVVFTAAKEFIYDWVEQLNGCLLNTVVEQLTVLMQD